MGFIIMETDKKIIAAINAIPTDYPLTPSKVLMDRHVQDGQAVTEERKNNLKALLS